MSSPEKKLAEIEKKHAVFIHEHLKQTGEYIITFYELQRRLKEYLALNLDELDEPQKQNLVRFLDLNPLQFPGLHEHIKIILDPYKFQEQIDKGLDPFYVPEPTKEDLDPFFKVLGTLYIQRYYKYYQETENPEKGLWAWATFQICAVHKLEIPSWVLKHFYTMATDLLTLIDTANLKKTKTTKLKAIIKDGKRTGIDKGKDINEAILKALGLKQKKYGSRSGIRQFAYKKRDYNIYQSIEKVKREIKNGELNLPLGKNCYEYVGQEFRLSEERTKRIYRAEKKKV